MGKDLVSIEKPLSQPPDKNIDHNHKWIIGFALLLLGGILLIRNLVGWSLDRWWFILFIIPSIGAFATAWRRYQSLGASGRSVIIRPMAMGTIFLIATVILLLDLEVQIFAPLLMIMAGVIAFVSILLR